MKTLLKHIKEALTNTNPAVRTATYQLIGTVHIYAGPSFGSLFEQEKPAILELINAEIEKVRGEKAPVPIRGKNVPKAGMVLDIFYIRMFSVNNRLNLCAVLFLNLIYTYPDSSFIFASLFYIFYIFRRSVKIDLSKFN